MRELSGGIKHGRDGMQEFNEALYDIGVSFQRHHRSSDLGAQYFQELAIGEVVGVIVFMLAIDGRKTGDIILCTYLADIR